MAYTTKKALREENKQLKQARLLQDFLIETLLNIKLAPLTTISKATHDANCDCDILDSMDAFDASLKKRKPNPQPSKEQRNENKWTSYRHSESGAYIDKPRWK